MQQQKLMMHLCQVKMEMNETEVNELKQDSDFFLYDPLDENSDSVIVKKELFEFEEDSDNSFDEIIGVEVTDEAETLKLRKKIVQPKKTTRFVDGLKMLQKLKF